MSSIGIDFGNESCAVAAARNRGIDMVLNEESKYEIPAIVNFGNKQRFFGAVGVCSAETSRNNTISQIKRLIGRRFSDPELQHDLPHFPFEVTQGPDGFPLLHVTYYGEKQAFTPTQVLAMVLAHLKILAERNLSTTISDCCIGIPVFFTDIQRRAILDAAKIAGLEPACLIHEMTAVALSYGVYKTDLPKRDPLNVAFVDIGHASMQVCIVGYKEGHLKVYGHAFDQTLGGRDFDNALFEHFSAKFEKEHEMNIYQNRRACARLLSACEKTKKVLSSNPVAHINIECLMNEKDMNYEIKREEFEKISNPILQRVVATLEKVMKIAKFPPRHIDEVEIVGSGSRVPVITRLVKKFFGKEPKRTMNASECVARGCALHCAMLNPTVQVREMKVEESFPFSVAVMGKYAANELPEMGMQEEWITHIFRSGSPTPCRFSLKLRKSKIFSFDVVYTDGIHSQTHSFSTYTIGPFPAEKGETNVSMLLTCNGIVSVTSAALLVDEEDPVSVNRKLVNCARINNRDDTVNRQATTQAKVSYMQTHMKIWGGLSSIGLQQAVEKEHDMTDQDKVVIETKERKNALESYVYKMREQIHGKYQDFIGEQEKKCFDNKLKGIENWLYNEGADVDKSVYIAQLEGLKKLAIPIEAGYKEDLERETVFKSLMLWLEYYREIISSGDTWWNHIDPMEKKKVLNECNSVEQRLSILKKQQDQSPKYEDPVLSCTDLKKAANDLKSFCRSILSKRRPQQNPQESSPLREMAGTSSLCVATGPYIGDTPSSHKVVEEYIVISQDKEMEKTKEAKKALKAYICSMRELHDEHQVFLRKSEKELLAHELQATADWLCSEDKDVDKGFYIAKLKELAELGRPIEVRSREGLEWEGALNFLVDQLNYYKRIAHSENSQWNHVKPAEKNKVINACSTVDQWLSTNNVQQGHLPKHVDVVVLCTNLKSVTYDLIRFCWPIISKAEQDKVSKPSTRRGWGTVKSKLQQFSISPSSSSSSAPSKSK